MCISAILGVASAAIGAGSARSAQRSQEQAAADQLALEERVYDETVERFDPFYESGQNALAAYNFELGLGERPTFGGTAPEVLTEEYQIPGVLGSAPVLQPGQNMDRMTDTERRAVMSAAGSPTMGTRYRVGDQTFDTREAADQYAGANLVGGGEYRGFQATPGYEFALGEGQRAIDNSAASRGGLFSGATLRAQQQYGTGMANQEYNNYLNRLTGQVASGQAAAGNQANAGANLAAGGSAAIGAAGDAGAAGAIGFGNALQGGIGNALGMWNYQRQQTAGLSSLPGGTQAGIW